MRGYNAQAVADEGQIVLAAEITNSTVDWSQLDPMVIASPDELDRAGVRERPQTAVADSEYWNEQHMDEVVAHKHVQVLIPPDGKSRKPSKGWTGGRYSWMRTVLPAVDRRGLRAGDLAKPAAVRNAPFSFLAPFPDRRRMAPSYVPRWPVNGPPARLARSSGCRWSPSPQRGRVGPRDSRTAHGLSTASGLARADPFARIP